MEPIWCYWCKDRPGKYKVVFRGLVIRSILGLVCDYCKPYFVAACNK